MKKLERSLGLFSVIGICIGAMLGSGIFVLPGLAAAKTGPSVWIAYVIAGLCALPAALSKAELATALPTSGGSYIHIDRSFGPFIGTISGLGLWLANLLKGAFALVGFGVYLSVFTTLPLKLVAVGMLALIVLLNLVGVKKVGKIQIVIVLIALGSLAVLVVMGFPTLDPTVFQGPQLTQGFGGLLATAGFVFVSYDGVSKAAAVAEEVRHPETNLPIGILVSLFIVTIVYGLVVFIMSGNIPADVFVTTQRPVYLLAQQVGGPIIGTLGAVLGLLTMTSMANAGLLASSRFPFAMSRDKMLPAVLGSVNSRFLTPVVAVLLTGAVMAAAILLLDIERLAKLASAFVIAVFIVDNLCVIVLRESSAQWYKPSYRSPFYPWTQIFGVVSGIGLLAMMGLDAVVGLVIVVVPGALLYLFYGRNRTERIGEMGKIGGRKDLAFSHLKKDASGGAADAPRTTVLISLFGNERSPETIVEMGIALAEKHRLVVQHITEIHGNELVEPKLQLGPTLYSLQRRLTAMSKDRSIDIEFKTVASRDAAKTIHQESDSLAANCLVLAWGGRRHLGRFSRDPHAWLLSHIRCDLALFKDMGVRYIRKILVYANPGPHDVLVVTTADHLAKQYDAVLTLVQFVDDDVPAPIFQSHVDYLDELRHLCVSETKARILRGKSLIDAMTAETAYHDLLVLGAPPETGFKRLLLRNPEDKITAAAACSVLRLKTPELQTHTALRTKTDTSITARSPIQRYLALDCADVQLPHTKKDALFAHFARSLAKQVKAHNATEIEKALWDREKTQNTSVGHGLALPHATLDSAKTTILKVFTTARPVDYGASDGEKTDVFIATLGPPSDRQTHLELLGNVAQLVVGSSILRRLRSATTSAEAIAAIHDSVQEIEQEPGGRSSKT